MKQTAVLSVRSGWDKILRVVPADDRLPALVFMVTESVFVGLALFGNANLKIVTVIGMAVVACFFISKFFHTVGGRQISCPDSERTAIVQEVVVTDQSFGHDVNQLYALATALMDEGAFEEALPYLRTIARLTPQHYKARYNIASCLMMSGQGERALEVLDTLISDLEAERCEGQTPLMRILSNSYNKAGNICGQKNDHLSAYRWFRVAVMKSPDEPLYQLNLLAACARIGNEREAVVLFEQLRSRPEGDRIFGLLPPDDLRYLSKFSWFKWEVNADG